MKCYLDNGATTQVDKEVVKAMQPYFTENYGNASSLHTFGQEAKKALEKSRETIAKAINLNVLLYFCMRLLKISTISSGLFMNAPHPIADKTKLSCPCNCPS